MINAMIVLAVIPEIPLPGVTTIGDLMLKLDPSSPRGALVALELAQLKEFWFEYLLRRNAGLASIWTEIQCEECKCTNWFTGWPFYREKVDFAWEAYGRRHWVQCDLSLTDWGKKHKDDRNPLNRVDDDMIFLRSFYLREIPRLLEQCREQAENSCDK